MFGGPYTFTPTNHHDATQGFLAVVKNGRLAPVLDHQSQHELPASRLFTILPCRVADQTE